MIYNVSKINSQVQIIMKYNVFIYLSIQEKTACCYLLIIIHLPVNTYLFIIYWLHHNFLNFSTNHFSYKKLVSRQFLIISIKICARKSWEIFVSPLLFFFFFSKRGERRGGESLHLFERVLGQREPWHFRAKHELICRTRSRNTSAGNFISGKLFPRYANKF